MITKKILDATSIAIFTIIGQASYHIYLVQMLYFGFRLKINIQTGIIYEIMINLTATVLIGVIFYYSETGIRNFIKRKSI